MEQIEILLQEIKQDLAEIKALLSKPVKPVISEDWIPRECVMEFFNYGDTQIAAFQKNDKIVVSKVGKRIFFNRKSLLQAIEDGRLN